MDTILKQIKNQLFLDQDVYESFRNCAPDLDYPHTNLHSPIVDVLLDLFNPSFWLEIGSMLGGSAIVTAKQIKNRDSKCEIVCIDPFCGDVNMWCYEKEAKVFDRWRFLNIKNGCPTIRERFMANICHYKMEDIIIPIPTTSTVGISLLEKLLKEGRISYRPEVIYLDSAHEEKETLIELEKSWDLLKEGGVLFGDDWGWDAVNSDLRKFASSIKSNEEVANKVMSLLHDTKFENDILVHSSRNWLLFK